MTLFERLGVGMVLFVLILDAFVGLQNFGPIIATMGILLLVIGFVVFTARGSDD